MQSETFDIESQAETDRFAKGLAGLLQPGDVVGLSGDLGAGKTTLCRTVVYSLGIDEQIPVTSPTFTIINEYRGSLPIYHMDLYRLGDSDELYELGLWEYYEGEGVCLVEWYDRFDDLWPPEALLLDIQLLAGERRRITARGTGRGEALVASMRAKWNPLS